MTEIDPFALSYNTDQHAVDSVVNKPIDQDVKDLQAAIDLAKITPVEDAMKETLRLAVLAGGANATLGLKAPSALIQPDTMQLLEQARLAAHQEQILKEAEQARILGNATIDLA